MKDSYRALLDERRRVLREALAPALRSRLDIVCEIGCGHGHFLTAFAAANPARVCVGIDLVGERIERAGRKRDRARLGNLHFLRTEARLFFETLPAEARVETFFILFPDPWPKLRHHKHRIMQPDFLTTIAGRATPGCRLYFRTDFGPYFADAQAAIRDHPHWQLVAEPWLFEYATVFQQRAESYHSLVAALRPPASTKTPG
jgi:tRNA (guanine-N7-)-methyltransferase